MTNLRRLTHFLRPYTSRMGGAIVAMVGVAAANTATIAMIEPVVDNALSVDATAEIARRLAAVIVMLYLALGITRYLSSYLMGSVGYAVIRDLRVHVYRHLQFLPLGYHARRTTGGLMSRVTSDVLAIQEALTRVFVDLVREGLALFGLLAWMIYIDPVLALLVLTVAPLLVSIIARLGKRLRNVSRETQRGLGEISALLQETLTGIRVVKAFGMEHAESEKFRRAAERLYRHSLRSERLSSIGGPLMEFIGACGGALVLLYGSWKITNGDLTTGEFTSFLAAAFATYSPLRRLSSANVRVQAAASAADRLFDVLDAELEPLPEAFRLGAIGAARSDSDEPRVPVLPNTPMPALVAGIRFESVSFAYADGGHDEQVLYGIDLNIPAGSAVALVGSSGAGKSTLANLIPRFYEPTAGRVTIDGVDLCEIRLDELREQISMVTQDTILFNDTVRNNIAYCQPDVTAEAVTRAAQAACAHGFIERLPDGYETVLGERGLRLSGGQRQRIAIARALLKNAPILVLDEATSNLDARSDQLVQEALVNLMEGRTTVIIAHRLSTIRSADLIVVVEGGRVAEQGTHEQLLSRMGAYQRFYSLQFVGAADHGFSLEG